MRQQQQKRRETAVFESLENRALFNATISGLVHNDVNGDGIIDEFSVLPAVRVYLDNNANGRRDNGELSVVTDLNGQYEFKDIPQGEYLVRFDLPAGWTPTNPAASVGEPVIFSGGTDKVGVPDALIRYGSAPWTTVGQNAQHTGISPFRGGPLTNTPSVVTSTDPNQPDTGDKFGTPLFPDSKFGIVIVPLFDSDTQKFAVRAYSRAFGATLWTFTSDYVAPPSVSSSLSPREEAAVFQPALGADGKLYIPGAGGTVWVMGALDDLRKTGTRTAQRVVFYGKDQFHTKPGRYRRTMFINTPLTAGRNGDVYFGVESNGANPLGISSSLARARADGTGARVRADVVTGSAPALSNDGSFVYVATQTKNKAYLARFHAGGGMAEAGSILLKDPGFSKKVKKVQFTPGVVAVPVVAPDGDVYLTTPARKPSVKNKGNGWLMRFSADLKVKGTQAQVMPDATPSIVPASMVPSYHGRSSYLLTTARFVPETVTLTVTDPGQQNVPAQFRTTHEFTTALPNQRLSLFDPAASLRRVGAEFLLPAVQAGSDPDTNDPFYVQGIVSSPVTVDPSSGAIYLVDVAGQVMRWNVANVLSVTAPVSLSSGLSNNSPVVDQGGNPIVIGPDGEVYVIATTFDQSNQFDPKQVTNLFVLF